MTNDSYVGYTRIIPFELRFYKHKLNAGLGIGTHLYRAMRKYGVDKFSFNILEVGENEHFGLNVSEPMYIRWLRPEYNMTLGGDGILGFVFTEEQRKENSKRQLGKPKPIRTLEHNKKLADSKRGIPRSEECKRKISLSKLGKPAYWNKNKIVTMESRFKMSVAAKNRIAK